MKRFLLIWLGIIVLLVLIYGAIIEGYHLLQYLNEIHKEYYFWAPFGILLTFAFAAFVCNITQP